MDPKSSRILALVFSFIVLVALTLLAISLNRLHFDPGLPLPLDSLLPNFIESGGSSAVMQVLIPIVRITMIISWILLPFCIVYLILSKQARMQLLRDLAFILPIIFFIYLIAKALMSLNIANQQPPGQTGLSGDALLKALNLPPFVPPPNWVDTTAVLFIAAFGAFVVFQMIILFWPRQRHRKKDALAVVRHDLQDALNAIESGNDLQNAITVCYWKMMTAIKEYRQLSRDQDMTPHEFERYLEHCGLPHDPIHRLTQLFEKVRYGAWRPNLADEQEALESLSVIIAACQQPRTI